MHHVLIAWFNWLCMGLNPASSSNRSSQSCPRCKAAQILPCDANSSGTRQGQASERDGLDPENIFRTYTGNAMIYWLASAASCPGVLTQSQCCSSERSFVCQGPQSPLWPWPSTQCLYAFYMNQMLDTGLPRPEVGLETPNSLLLQANTLRNGRLEARLSLTPMQTISSTSTRQSR